MDDRKGWDDPIERPLGKAMILSPHFYRFAERIANILSHRYFPAGVVVISILLAWPSLHAGWFADDLLHRAAYLDTPDANRYYPPEDRLKGPMRMYSFFDGNERRYQYVLDLGGIPWWCDGKIRATFWRPFTALCSMLDYRLWPNSSERMHVHSFAWFVVLVMASGMLYRNIMGPGWAAGLAVLLFAVNDIQAVPITFLANRHIVIAAVFGMVTLLCHDRWRCHLQIQWAVLANVFLLLSLLSSESGVSVFAYLLSYSLWIEQGTIRSRLTALIPYFIIIIVWRMVYTSLGYGISGIPLYTDPGNEPLHFAFVVLERLPILILGLLATPPSDIYMLLTPFALRLYWLAAILVLFTLGWLFFPLWRRCNLSRFWMMGTLLSVIPLCAAIPGSRSLALAGFGAMGWIAQVLNNLLSDTQYKDHSLVYRYAMGGILIGMIWIRLLTGSVVWMQNGNSFAWLQKGIDRVSYIDVFEADLANQDVIFVNPPVPIAVVYLITNRLLANQPIPAHIRILAPGLDLIELYRSDERTLLVRPRNGYLNAPQWHMDNWMDIRTYIDPINGLKRFERMLLNRNNPLRIGDKIELTGVSILITKLTEDNRPAEVAFTFNTPLEDSSLRWFQWNKKNWVYEEFPIPGIGETANLY